MKIRSQNSKYHTDLDEEDFLLKEFSQDKEKFVLDEELSCCDCGETDDPNGKKDSSKTFLIKFKADNLKDPQVIKPGTKGFKLPEEDHTFTYQEVSSSFVSIQNNHFVMHLNEAKARALAKEIHRNQERLVDLSIPEVSTYICSSIHNQEWKALYAREDKTNWKKFLKSKLREKYESAYGKLNNAAAVKEALKIDKENVLSQISLLKGHDLLNENELNIINSIIA